MIIPEKLALWTCRVAFRTKSNMHDVAFCKNYSRLFFCKKTSHHRCSSGFSIRRWNNYIIYSTFTLDCTHQTASREWKSGWTNLLLRALFFGRTILFARPIGYVKKNRRAKSRLMCKSNWEQLETTIFVLYYLNRAYSFHFYYNFIKSFCNEAFAMWMLFECLK